MNEKMFYNEVIKQSHITTIQQLNDSMKKNESFDKLYAMTTLELTDHINNLVREYNKRLDRRSLPGYNENPHVKHEHIFIEGKGSFYFSEKEAHEYDNNPNGVGGHIEMINVKGFSVYRKQYRNVWN